MALDHAILVSLAERPGTGYELSRQFDRSIGHFWSTSHQQIYRTLKRLAEEGLILATDVAQSGKPDKRIFTVSAAGHAALREWISTPTPLPELRNDFGVKLRGAEHADLAVVRANVAAHRDAHQEQLDLYRRYAATQFPHPDDLEGRALHQYLVLRGGIRTEAAFVDWCEEILDALPTPSAKGTP